MYVERFTAQIIVISHPTKIKNGYLPLVYCNVSRAPCRLQCILAKIDKKSGEIIESEPESIKTGDSAIVEFVPEKPIYLEPFAKFPALGRLVIQDCHLTVAVGVVKQVEKVSTFY